MPRKESVQSPPSIPTSLPCVPMHLSSIAVTFSPKSRARLTHQIRVVRQAPGASAERSRGLDLGADDVTVSRPGSTSTIQIDKNRQNVPMGG